VTLEAFRFQNGADLLREADLRGLPSVNFGSLLFCGALLRGLVASAQQRYENGCKAESENMPAMRSARRSTRGQAVHYFYLTVYCAANDSHLQAPERVAQIRARASASV